MKKNETNVKNTTSKAVRTVQKTTKRKDKLSYKPVSPATEYGKIIYDFVKQQRRVTTGEITKNHKDYTDSLYNLATVIVAGVLKKIYQASGNENIRSLKNQNFDKRTLDNIKYAVENSTKTTFNKNGSQIVEIIDVDLYNSIEELIKKGISDNMELIHNCICNLLEYVNGLTVDEIMLDSVFFSDNEDNYNVYPPINFLTKLITVEHVSNKVYITDFLTINEDSNKHKVKVCTEKTSKLQDLHRLTRRDIREHDENFEVDKNYIFVDKEDENGNLVYENMLNYNCFDFSLNDGYSRKKEYIKTEYDRFCEIVSELKLTDMQKVVLSYRLKDGGMYGYKAIATATGYSINTVVACLRYIRRKAVNAGIVPAVDNLITDDNTPIKKGVDLAKCSDTSIGVNIIDSARSNTAKDNITIDLSHVSDKKFKDVDISMVCDKNMPTLKANTALKAFMYETFDIEYSDYTSDIEILANMTNEQYLIYASYMITNNGKSRVSVNKYAHLKGMHLSATNR